MKTHLYQKSGNDFQTLSVRDLLDAREMYHLHLMNRPNVVATAIGKYRIRSADSWPNENGPGKVHGRAERTLQNSEIRPYSWPCILVFVDKWEDENAFGKGNSYEPSD